MGGHARTEGAARQEHERLGPYRLVARVGEGGMGVVHLGLDPDGRTVAVKELRPQVASDRNSRARLAREVETMRRVRSRHVAEVLDADVYGERPYIVTRYVPGRPLDDVVSEGGALTGEPLTRLARGLADALSAIHSADIVHRDVKPGNVLLVDGEPVVIDFGVAQAVDATKLTTTGMFIGTPAYLAPEVIRGDTAAAAADMHAWAAVVAFAATGRPPFGSGSFQVVFYNIEQGRADLAGIPEPLAGLVRAGLASDPASRPSAAWLRDRAGALPTGGGQRKKPPIGAPGAETVAFDGPTEVVSGQAHPGDTESSPPAPPGSSPGTRAYTAYGAPAAGDDAAGRPARRHPGDSTPYLPPATGPSPETAAYRAAAANRPPREPPARIRRPRPAIEWMLAGLAAGFVAVVPFAGAAVLTLVLLALRTADGVAGGLAARRSRRGPSGVDPVLGVVGMPWHLAGAVWKTVLVLPLALLAGVVGYGIGFAVQGGYAAPARCVALAGCAFVAVSLFGPGAGKPRRRAQQALTAALADRWVAVAVGIVVAVVLLFVLAAVGAAAVIWWPMDGAPSPHLPDLDVASGLFDLIGGFF